MRNQKEKVTARRRSTQVEHGAPSMAPAEGQSMVPPDHKKSKPEPQSAPEPEIDTLPSSPVSAQTVVASQDIPTPKEVQASMNRALKLVWDKHHPGETFPSTPQGGKCGRGCVFVW